MNIMKRCCAVCLTLVAFGVGAARAAPPTVVPSPGYDARLQEQRAARAAPTEPALSPARQITPRHHKRSRTRR